MAARRLRPLLKTSISSEPILVVDRQIIAVASAQV
jgi:hypothetical protein